MKSRYAIKLAAAVLLFAAGCNFILGSADQELPSASDAPFNLNFYESLRNQRSLRGESYKEYPGAPPSGFALQRPNSVFADQFRVYVTDTGQQPGVYIFDRGEASFRMLPIASPDHTPILPAGIAVDGPIIFVSDQTRGRVLGFDHKGNRVYLIGRAQVMNSRNGLGELLAPTALAIDPRLHRLYVADTHAHMVKAYTTTGDHLFDLGNTGRAEEDFKSPNAIAVDRVGRIFVLDSLRHRVFIFRSDGVFQSSFSLKRAVPGQSIRPAGIAVDSDGHIYVIDSVKNNVLIFNPDGGLVLTWGRMGRLTGDFWTPSGIFIDDQNIVYVADQSNSRVQTFRYVK